APPGGAARRRPGRLPDQRGELTRRADEAAARVLPQAPGRRLGTSPHVHTPETPLKVRARADAVFGRRRAARGRPPPADPARRRGLVHRARRSPAKFATGCNTATLCHCPAAGERAARTAGACDSGRKNASAVPRSSTWTRSLNR